MNKTIAIFIFMCFPFFSFGQKKAVNTSRRVIIQFENTANGKKIYLNDNTYKNDAGELYTVSKLKYYISNLRLVTDKKPVKKNSVYLVNAGKNNFINLKMPPGNIKAIQFLLGADSALNCSGAQSGALDPLNDMFWTWNNGYVMFKLEGKSSSSSADLNRIEQHIGGYKGEYKTMRNIIITINHKKITAGDTLTVQLNLDKYWKGKNEIRIAEKPMITTIGPAANDAADNFSGMFFIK